MTPNKPTPPRPDWDAVISRFKTMMANLYRPEKKEHRGKDAHEP